MVVSAHNPHLASCREYWWCAIYSYYRLKLTALLQMAHERAEGYKRAVCHLLSRLEAAVPQDPGRTFATTNDCSKDMLSG